MAKVKYRQPIHRVISNRKQRVQRGNADKTLGLLYSKNQFGENMGIRTKHNPKQTEEQKKKEERFKFCDCAWKHLTRAQKKALEFDGLKLAGPGTYPPSLYSIWMYYCLKWKTEKLIKKYTDLQGDLSILGYDSKYLYFYYYLHNPNYARYGTIRFEGYPKDEIYHSIRTFYPDLVTEIRAVGYDSNGKEIGSSSYYTYTPIGGKWHVKVPVEKFTIPNAVRTYYYLFHENVILDTIKLEHPIPVWAYYCNCENRKEVYQRIGMKYPYVDNSKVWECYESNSGNCGLTSYDNAIPCCIFNPEPPNYKNAYLQMWVKHYFDDPTETRTTTFYIIPGNDVNVYFKTYVSQKYKGMLVMKAIYRELIWSGYYHYRYVSSEEIPICAYTDKYMPFVKIAVKRTSNNGMLRVKAYIANQEVLDYTSSYYGYTTGNIMWNAKTGDYTSFIDDIYLAVWQ